MPYLKVLMKYLEMLDHSLSKACFVKVSYSKFIPKPPANQKNVCGETMVLLLLLTVEKVGYTTLSAIRNR